MENISAKLFFSPFLLTVVVECILWWSLEVLPRHSEDPGRIQFMLKQTPPSSWIALQASLTLELGDYNEFRCLKTSLIISRNPLALMLSGAIYLGRGDVQWHLCCPTKPIHVTQPVSWSSFGGALWKFLAWQLLCLSSKGRLKMDQNQYLWTKELMWKCPVELFLAEMNEESLWDHILWPFPDLWSYLGPQGVQVFSKDNQ